MLSFSSLRLPLTELPSTVPRLPLSPPPSRLLPLSPPRRVTSRLLPLSPPLRATSRLLPLSSLLPPFRTSFPLLPLPFHPLLIRSERVERTQRLRPLSSLPAALNPSLRLPLCQFLLELVERRAARGTTSCQPLPPSPNPLPLPRRATLRQSRAVGVAMDNTQSACINVRASLEL